MALMKEKILIPFYINLLVNYFLGQAWHCTNSFDRYLRTYLQFAILVEICHLCSKLAPKGPLSGVGFPVSLEEPLLAERHLAHAAGEGLHHLLAQALLHPAYLHTGGYGTVHTEVNNWQRFITD
jgi:hypothetical protein